MPTANGPGPAATLGRNEPAIAVLFCDPRSKASVFILDPRPLVLNATARLLVSLSLATENVCAGGVSKYSLRLIVE
jgi:hypothetical protein